MRDFKGCAAWDKDVNRRNDPVHDEKPLAPLRGGKGILTAMKYRMRGSSSREC
jgi:hypothetical protein